MLLFRSSKLNEQKANLLKSSNRSNSLQRLNDDPSIQKYFPERSNVRMTLFVFVHFNYFLFLKNLSRHSNQDEEEEFFTTKNDLFRARSMHLEHNEKKYHVQFLKKYQSENPSTDHRHLLLPDRLAPRNLESLFSTENSTIQGRSSDANTSTIHRESKTFPLRINSIISLEN